MVILNRASVSTERRTTRLVWVKIGLECALGKSQSTEANLRSGRSQKVSKNLVYQPRCASLDSRLGKGFVGEVGRVCKSSSRAKAEKNMGVKKERGCRQCAFRSGSGGRGERGKKKR